MSYFTVAVITLNFFAVILEFILKDSHILLYLNLTAVVCFSYILGKDYTK